MQATVKAIASAVNKLLDVPSMDPDAARRGKLLNILLLGMFAMGLAGLLIISIFHFIGQRVTSPYLEDAAPLFPVTFGVLAGIAIIYAVNRYWISWVAGSLFVLLLIAAAFAGDEIEQVIRGRSLVLFAIPIVMSSVLVRPYAAFVTAGIVTVAFFVVGFSVQILPDPFALVIFTSIALASWLSARAMEHAIKDLQILNVELDTRVVERTRQLSERTEQLAEALAKTEAILGSTADSIVVFDTDGRAAIANSATERLLGQSPQEIIGCDITELMKDSVNTYDQEVIVDILKDKTAHYPSLKVQWNDKTLSMSAAPVKLDSGEEIGTVAVFRDFTQEAEVDRMKSTFLSIASHDLRSPLSAILGLTELIREEVFTSSEEQRYAIDRIYANTEYMLSLANSLLGQAQIEAGILQLRLAPLSPSDLVEEVTTAMGVLAQDRGLELTGHVGDDLPPSVIGDREKLSQVLFNLVGNAIKFTEEGSVQVRAFAADEAHWALAVSDTGRGIPEDAQDVIFEPFRQVEGTSAAGVGLGLTIVKQLVDLMDGEIHLESAVGKGSTFTVVLPITAN
jgi:PAS domain S-box-containing protein